jgi:hypothetical protein
MKHITLLMAWLVILSASIFIVAAIVISVHHGFGAKGVVSVGLFFIALVVIVSIHERREP